MKTFSIKTIALSFVAMMLSAASYAVDIDFTVTGITGNIANTINNNVGCILSACNEAQEKGGTPDLSKLMLSEEVCTQVLMTFEDCPFFCPDPDLVRPGKKLKNGNYEIRNVPIVMVPRDKKTGTWQTYQDLVFTVNPDGDVVNFRLSLNREDYLKAMSAAKDVKEMEELNMINEYLERFRNAYILKDINFLEQVFSDDALIITGNVIKTQKSELSQQVKYTQYTKKDYIKHLRDEVFQRNKKIDVTFKDVSVKRHDVIEGLYGVQLTQGWKSDRYQDVGYLFLLWDFRDPDQPQIHIRTWQDERIWTENPKTKEKIYSMESFDLDDF